MFITVFSEYDITNFSFIMSDQSTTIELMTKYDLNLKMISVSDILKILIFIQLPMNRQKSVATDIQIQQYSEKNKLRSLFSELMKEIIVKRPQDPIQFLVQYLDKRNRRQIICICGYDHQQRTKVSTIVANKYNYRHINLSQIFKGDYHSLSDEELNQKVVESLKATQSVYKGIIISGYPSNLPQLNFIQKSEFIPDRYFLINDNQQQVETQYRKIYTQEQTIQSILLRNSIHFKQLVKYLGSLADYLPFSGELSTQNIISALSFKNKKVVPLDSPRIVILHPPFLRPTSIKSFISKYLLHEVSIASSFRKMSENSSFKDYVQSTIRKTGSISKQIELALIESQSKSAPSKTKGLALIGWPTSVSNFCFMKQDFIRPHLIIAFTEIDEKAKPLFENANPEDLSIFPICPKPSIGQFEKQLIEYKQLIDKVKNGQNVQLLKLDEKEDHVLKTFENLIENNRIYS